MDIEKTKLDGVLLITPQVFSDARGFFLESWSERAFEAAGLVCRFVQDNHSYSARRGTLRGLHMQLGSWSQTKLAWCVQGGVLDVAVDLRPDSPSYRKWVAVELTAQNKRRILVPKGFGHGFLTLTDDVEFMYKVDSPYCPEAECAIRWNDPELRIGWGIADPILSDKDRASPVLREAEALLRRENTGFQDKG